MYTHNLIAENSCFLWHDTASPGNQILIFQGNVLSSSLRSEMSKNSSWAFRTDAMMPWRVKTQSPSNAISYTRRTESSATVLWKSQHSHFHSHCHLAAHYISSTIKTFTTINNDHVSYTKHVHLLFCFTHLFLLAKQRLLWQTSQVYPTTHYSQLKSCGDLDNSQYPVTLSLNYTTTPSNA
jgi:hypothetical protein